MQRRRVRTELVLFPGYVFARLNDEQRTQIAKTNTVVRFIEIPNPREVIHQLRQIRTAGKLGPLNPTERFTTDELVRVKAGPFYGLKGYVKTVDNGGRMLVLNIEILGQAVAVDIQAADCEHVSA